MELFRDFLLHFFPPCLLASLLHWVQFVLLSYSWAWDLYHTTVHIIKENLQSPSQHLTNVNSSLTVRRILCLSLFRCAGMLSGWNFYISCACPKIWCQFRCASALFCLKNTVCWSYWHFLAVKLPYNSPLQRSLSLKAKHSVPWMSE